MVWGTSKIATNCDLHCRNCIENSLCEIKSAKGKQKKGHPAPLNWAKLQVPWATERIYAQQLFCLARDRGAQHAVWSNAKLKIWQAWTRHLLSGGLESSRAYRSQSLASVLEQELNNYQCQGCRRIARGSLSVPNPVCALCLGQPAQEMKYVLTL